MTNAKDVLLLTEEVPQSHGSLKVGVEYMAADGGKITITGVKFPLAPKPATPAYISYDWESAKGEKGHREDGTLEELLAYFKAAAAKKE